MLLLLINIVIVIVVGAILFYVIDRFVRDGRLANLLKILVALICLAAILQRLLPMIGWAGFSPLRGSRVARARAAAAVPCGPRTYCCWLGTGF